MHDEDEDGEGGQQPHSRDGVGGRGERRLNLGQSGQAGLLQHQANVRVGDELPVAVDDVGIARLADLHARCI